eukprot:2987539-Rhodomonas_salina.2
MPESRSLRSFSAPATCPSQNETQRRGTPARPRKEGRQQVLRLTMTTKESGVHPSFSLSESQAKTVAHQELRQLERAVGVVVVAEHELLDLLGVVSSDAHAVEEVIEALEAERRRPAAGLVEHHGRPLLHHRLDRSFGARPDERRDLCGERLADFLLEQHEHLMQDCIVILLLGQTRHPEPLQGHVHQDRDPERVHHGPEHRPQKH